jgi:hypothetical protein
LPREWYSSEILDCFDDEILNADKLEQLIRDILKDNSSYNVEDILIALWSNTEDKELEKFIITHIAAGRAFATSNPENARRVRESVLNWEDASTVINDLVKENRENGFSFPPFEERESSDSQTVPPTQQNKVSEFSSPIMERVEKWKNWEYIFFSSVWNIPITMEDLNALNNNPEAEVNLTNLYTNFLDTWLERLWSHKDAIFKSLWNNWGFKFNSQDGQYVDTREANELFSTILYITTENPSYKETGLSLEETKSAIIRETHWAAGETNVEKIWEQWNKLEKSFIDKFTMRDQGDEWRFNYTAFDKALRWDFSPNSR